MYIRAGYTFHGNDVTEISATCSLLRQGEVGREMYIVNKGLVCVVGGVSDGQVLAELGPGSIFGEIR